MSTVCWRAGRHAAVISKWSTVLVPRTVVSLASKPIKSNMVTSNTTKAAVKRNQQVQVTEGAFQYGVSPLHKKKSSKPSVHKFNKDLEQAAERHNFHKLMWLVKEMKALDVKPDAMTYHVILKGFANLGLYPASLDVLDEMSAMGFKPKVSSFNLALTVSPPKKKSLGKNARAS